MKSLLFAGHLWADCSSPQTYLWFECVKWCISILFFNSLTEFIQNSGCDWPNKSCNILPMPVINQILLPCRNLKFIFYKACIVVFRNHIEWAASPPQLNLVILKSTGSNLRRSVEGWGEFIENLKWIKIHWKYLAFLPYNKHQGCHKKCISLSQPGWATTTVTFVKPRGEWNPCHKG